MARRSLKACRPRRKVKWSGQAPRRVGQRRQIKQKCGSGCFLAPQGTPGRPSVPGYPVCGKAAAKSARSCCISCDGLRAARNRAAINANVAAKKRQRKTAAFHRKIKAKADRRGKALGCSWAK